ncbi:MAG TPA: alpha/beta fold hydrolase [Candidatus Cybelea sp.]|nr:alpha/beta fold hydrolase [Candidatus Cybelea sp.]
MPTLHEISRRRAIAAGLALMALTRPRGTRADQPYDDITYKSGSLSIEAYLYRPSGTGPAPLIIYNHGSREGAEGKSVPWVRIANLFRDAGYAVLVPERRGYGKSEGVSWSDAVGHDTGKVFLDRCHDESDDVLAAAAYAAGLSFVDRSRIGIVGWSLGGIVTLLAVSRSAAFKAAVVQASGALTWRHSTPLQSTLVDAARTAKCPVFLMDAANDAAPEDIPTLADAMQKAGLPHQMTMYPAFTPSSNPANIAPGHLLFGPEGLSIWGHDAVAFLNAALKP